MSLRACLFSLSLGTLVLLSFSCKEKKSSKDNPGASGAAAPCDAAKDPSCKSTSSGTALTDVCSGVNQNDVLKEYSALTVVICSGGTSGLQALIAKSLYTGSGTSTVQDLNSEELPQKQSRIKFLSVMRVNTKPQSYFNLMKLEITQPSQYKAAGFETDEKVNYEVKSAQGDTASYRYKNTSEAPEVVVDYTASVRFVTLVPDKAFLVATTLDKSAPKEAIQALIGYSLIFTSGATTTDVVSISDQTYDNNGNHSTTLAKAKRATQTEQLRSFRNGQNADKASGLVK